MTYNTRKPRTARQWLIFDVANHLIVANDPDRTFNQSHILETVKEIGNLKRGLTRYGLRWSAVNAYWNGCTTLRKRNLLVGDIIDTIRAWLRDEAIMQQIASELTQEALFQMADAITLDEEGTAYLWRDGVFLGEYRWHNARRDIIQAWDEFSEVSGIWYALPQGMVHRFGEEPDVSRDDMPAFDALFVNPRAADVPLRYNQQHPTEEFPATKAAAHDLAAQAAPQRLTTRQQLVRYAALAIITHYQGDLTNLAEKSEQVLSRIVRDAFETMQGDAQVIDIKRAFQDFDALGRRDIVLDARNAALAAHVQVS